MSTCRHWALRQMSRTACPESSETRRRIHRPTTTPTPFVLHVPTSKQATIRSVSNQCGVGVPTLLLHQLNGFFSRTTWVSWYQNCTASLDLNEARYCGVLGCSGISWTICNLCKQSAPRSNTNQFFTGRVLFLTPNQHVKALKANAMARVKYLNFYWWLNSVEVNSHCHRPKLNTIYKPCSEVQTRENMFQNYM